MFPFTRLIKLLNTNFKSFYCRSWIFPVFFFFFYLFHPFTLPTNKNFTTQKITINSTVREIYFTESCSPRILILSNHGLGFPFSLDEILGSSASLLNRNGPQWMLRMKGTKYLPQAHTNWEHGRWDNEAHACLNCLLFTSTELQADRSLTKLPNAPKGLCNLKSTAICVVEQTGFSSTKESPCLKWYRLI